MLESPAVCDLATEQIRDGVRALRLDLRDCAMMDSTFSGTLLALKRQIERVSGTLVLVSPSPRVLELLDLMGVRDFYDVESAERSDGEWTVVAPTQPKAERLQRTVLAAHAELARLPGTAGDAFRSVVDELRRPPPSSGDRHLH